MKAIPTMSNTRQVDLYDAHQLPQWVDQLRSGQTESVSIVDDDVVVAVLRQPPTEPTTPPGWIVAGNSFDDKKVPPPFKIVGSDSNNLGAMLWIHLQSGAMIAALPSGKWNEPHAQFRFFYAASVAAVAIELIAWSANQERWGDAGEVDARRAEAIAYFNNNAR
ncbi:hypothetical protein [Mycolicibacterium mucogenicum]|uniref:hypothetical protein n=1 Tax=Mycolicibacterium mucogenicum TaxID=56689 RepID=UPI00226A264A|nr:hypothetical protein [Mycolicibacterium mucogenicum]